MQSRTAASRAQLKDQPLRRLRFYQLLAVLACTFLATTLQADNLSRPNIVVILTDDQGFADIGLNPHRAQEVLTPNMDSLAKDGVLFSQAYTSGHVCSPTRAGLMIGGYSQRVGVYTAGDGGRGFDPQRKIFPAFLPEEYVSAAIGKWHLGLDDDYPELKWHALNRGFDECYKFMGRGAHSYFDLRSDSTARFAHPLYRNKQRIDDEGYLTNRLTEEAVAFIDRNKDQPFFLYLAYNAVHAPAEAPPADIEAIRKTFPQLSEKRAILMAMLTHLDDGIGDVVDKLKQEGLFENTLLFFLTDNGGARAMSADNTPLRGYKASLYEGGIRTPFIVSWPHRFQGERTIEAPVISFDILPTALDAADSLSSENDFDGKSLLPLLTGQTTSHHDTLFWSKGREDEWAVRRGNWKLHYKRGETTLVDIASDPSESTNIADTRPKIVRELESAFADWIVPMATPITGGVKRVDSVSGQAMTPTTKRERRRARIGTERKKQRSQARSKQTSSDEPRREVDTTTLTGKVMAGYQGWFNCAGDGAQLGWKHWARDRNQQLAPGNVTVDLWPDVSELDRDELYRTNFQLADGTSANVFSSANGKTVNRHFAWMQEYGIDGVFLQRFAVGLSRPALLKNNNTVLSNVRSAAKRTGRAFAVMYDLSGLQSGQVTRVQHDWLTLASELEVADDETYLHHNGNPLVAVWGIGFSDNRKYSLQECADLVRWLKSNACSVMVGVPSFWREGRRDAVSDPLMHEIIGSADVVSPWTVGRYRTPVEAQRHATNVWRRDRKWCERAGVDFLPVVFPGFSWHNLRAGKLGQIPRLKGKFFWSQVEAAQTVGCDMLYVAMFDEADEGTAIFKCTNNPPVGDGVQFLTYEGLPSDFYLQLTGRAAKLIRGNVGP